MPYRFKTWTPFSSVSAVNPDGTPLSTKLTRAGVYLGTGADAGNFKETFRDQVEWDSRDSYIDACVATKPTFYWPMDDATTTLRDLGTEGPVSGVAEAALTLRAAPALVRGADSAILWPDPNVTASRCYFQTAAWTQARDPRRQSFVVWTRATKLPVGDHYFIRTLGGFIFWRTPNATSHRPTLRIYKADGVAYTQAQAPSAAALNGVAGTYWRGDAINRTDMAAFTYDGLVQRIYYNGVEVATAQHDYNPDQEVGNPSSSIYVPYTVTPSTAIQEGGSFGHAAMWHRALTAAEINDLWRVGCPLDA